MMLRGVIGWTPGITLPIGYSSPRGTGCPVASSFGRKSMAVSPLSSPRVMIASSLVRGG